jgi:hypothetical protein
MAMSEDDLATGQDIWVRQNRGQSLRSIAEELRLTRGKVKSTLERFKAACYDELSSTGQREVLGDLALGFKWIRGEIVGGIEASQAGSNARSQWANLYLRALKSEAEFGFESGLLTRAAERVDVTIRDIRKMTDEELTIELVSLREELAAAAGTITLLN